MFECVFLVKDYWIVSVRIFRSDSAGMEKNQKTDEACLGQAMMGKGDQILS